MVKYLNLYSIKKKNCKKLMDTWDLNAVLLPFSKIDGEMEKIAGDLTFSSIVNVSCFFNRLTV